MKNAKAYRVGAYILVIIGGYGFLNLIYKLMAGQEASIHRSDVFGIVYLVVGIILFVTLKKKSSQ